jgi:hypothetical protein
MPPTSTERTAVRREAIGTELDTTIISTADIDYYWDNGGSETILLTAALVCEMLAARAGGVTIPIVAMTGLSINRSVQPAELRKRAMELRRRYLYGDEVGVLVSSFPVAAVWADHDDAWAEDEGEFG